jgi:hypothetical protein
MLREQTDAAGVVIGKLGAYGGGASALWFGLSAGEFAAITGAVIGVLGYLTQLYFNRRRERRESEDRLERRAEHQARLERLRRGLDD